MNLADKVGQRLVVSFQGPELTTEVAQFITDCRAGGVILFRSNIENIAQVRQLNLNLQKLAAEIGLPPLIISVDEEGGRVSRMPFDATELTTPSPMAQNAAGGDAARTCAASTARRLRRLGFNLNYAPVLDVNNNPNNPVIGTRSFGSDAASVAELGAEAIAGYLAERVAPCAKHYPGHGDTDIDSHIGLPVVAKSLAQLRAIELGPFYRAVQAGVPAIMTAHIVYPEIEPEKRPATLSAFFLNMLRRELGFEGVIFTDALIMQAIADFYGPEQASLLALKAGADIVMPLGSLESQKACYVAMLEAAERGEFELEASANRISRLKQEFCLPALPLEGLEAELEIVTDVARRSLTLLRNTGGLLPLLPGKFRQPLLVEFEPAALSGVEEQRLEHGLTLHSLLIETLPELALETVFPNFTEEQAQQLLQTAAASDALVLICRNAARLEHKAALINRLLQLGRPTALVAARDPYDLAAFEAAALVATYGEPTCSLRALAGLLLGHFSPQGRLPLNIPGLTEQGKPQF